MKTRSRPKKRDAEATRARIVECAQQIFTDKGYDAAGIREIAACAGVNAALISRYFGSKRELFALAILPHFNIDTVLSLDVSDFAGAVAGQYSAKTHNAEKAFDPMIALLKSAASDEVRGMIGEAIDRQIIAPLGAKLDGAHARERAALIVAWLGGFDLFRRIIGVSSLSSADTAFLREEVQGAIERLISRSDADKIQ